LVKRDSTRAAGIVWSEDRRELFDKVLGISETAIDARKTDESDFVEISQILHAEISDVL
jgi:hypothetical protein